MNPFFNPEVREVRFLVNSPMKVLVPIGLDLGRVRHMDLQFTVRLEVPAAAMSQGVALGEPNIATVTIPASRGVYANCVIL